MAKRILGIVGWFGTALVFAAVAVRLTGWSGVAALPPDADRYAVYAAWVGLVCVLLYTAGQWREIGAQFQRRQTRYGAVASASVLIVLGILIAVNYLSARQNKRWDLTANQQFSLSDQTVQLLRNLEAPVKFLVFDQEANFDRFRTRLTEYEYHSNLVDVEYIDADRRPVQAREYDIQTYGTVVVEYQGRRERVTTDSEQDLTNALIKAISGEQKKIYFVQGHGEKDTQNSERDGYSAVVEALGRDNYAVETVVLAQQQEVPADASVLVVAGPRGDFLQPEAEMVRRYLARGGHVLFLLDPPESGVPPMPVIEGLLKEWAIEPGDNVVVDVSGIGQLIGTDASVPVAATYPSHPITQRFGMLTAYPLARSMAPISAGANGRYAQSFIQTSPRSWAETNIKQIAAGQEVQLDADQGDLPGPVSIGAAVSATATEATATPGEAAAKAENGENDAPKPESRLAAIGDSDFAANYALGIQGNRDLFMNAVNWLAQQENLIAIRPKDAGDRRITLTAGQSRMVTLVSLFLIPAAVLGAGVYSWWRRR